MASSWRLGVLAVIVLMNAGCPGRGGGDEVARPDEPHPAAATGPRIDIAFCLDATGSMQEEIDQAKTKIREIARWIEGGEPRPSVRFAVVAYRDKGEEYLTRTYGLAPDVAKTEAALGEIRADGGGDNPEHVVAGLRRAVDGLGWDEKAALKLIFLVGDAGPHLDYGPESDAGPVLAAAREKGIVIGAIACGNMAGGTEFFRKVAKDTGGPFETIASKDAIELESIVLEAIRTQAAKRGIRY